MDLLPVALAVVAALPAGWFAGVLIDRIPDAKPLFRPPPGLVADPRGPVRAALVTAATAVLFGLAALRFERPAQLVPVLVLLFVLLTLSVIDIDTLRLPDRLVFPSLLASLLLLPIASILLGEPEALRYAALGSAIYFGFLFIAHLIYPPGMGFGDVKLALLMGMYLGWLTTTWMETVALLLYAMLFGFVLGSVAGLIVFIIRGRSAGYPFGPFLALGTALAVLLHEPLLNP